jgi:hypothetical protein
MSIAKFLPLVPSSLAYLILRTEDGCIPAYPKEWWMGVETPTLKIGISNLAFIITRRLAFALNEALLI